MQTILEILNKTTQYFEKCGIPDPKLDAQYILAHGLQMSRMDLFLKFDRPLEDAELVKLRTMVARRSKREPLQHILGTTSFMGHTIRCDKRALIPRPETESLVGLVLKRIESIQNPYVADIGTGTGAIAIAVALARPDATVVAADVSKDALALAQENVQANGLEGRVLLIASNLMDSIPAEFRFHVIASNLPYIPSGDIPGLQPEVRAFDPVTALDGGKDGLEFVRKLLLAAPHYLAPKGYVLLEVGEGQAEFLQLQSAQFQGLEWISSHADLFGVVRFPEYGTT